MLMANSAAILTDAFPPERRGFALGTNQVAGLAGQFVGLVAGGLLAAIDWRAVFWVNVPVGVFGTLWAYRKLRDNGERHPGKIDWWGNITFAVGLGAVLIGITVGIQPYGHHTMGWANPGVLGLLSGGAALLAAFTVIETRIAEPMFQLSLFRIRAFTAGSVAGLVVAIARGGLQFVLIIWLQGIWLPLHGYDYSETPLWAGIFLLPLTAGFLISGPVSGTLSDRFGSRGIATAGMAVFGGSFIGLMLLPVNFPYWAFALLIAANGIGSGMFAAPNSSSIMGSVPARHRGAASGMRSTFQNSGTALSIGIVFSLMIAGLASTLPRTLTSGLARHGVPHAAAAHIGSLPPVASLFAAVLGVNPLQHLLAAYGALTALPAANRQVITGRAFFPDLISGPFHQGLVVVFAVAAALAAAGRRRVAAARWPPAPGRHRHRSRPRRAGRMPPREDRGDPAAMALPRWPRGLPLTAMAITAGRVTGPGGPALRRASRERPAARPTAADPPASRRLSGLTRRQASRGRPRRCRRPGPSAPAGGPKPAVTQPPPAADLPTVSDPPDASAMRRAMSRPRPVDPALDRPRWAASGSPKPGPASDTTSQAPPRARRLTRTVQAAPSGVCANTFSSRMSAQAARSSRETATSAGPAVISTVICRSWSSASGRQNAARSAITSLASQRGWITVPPGRRASRMISLTVRCSPSTSLVS